MVFNIFTVKFISVTKTCEAIKSSKPVFLCMTSFAEANQLHIRDGMIRVPPLQRSGQSPDVEASSINFKGSSQTELDCKKLESWHILGFCP